MSLDVRNLTKRYAGRAVVQDVSFGVEDGELVALLGPSGSGKSTILRMVAGLTEVDGGRVLVDDIDVTGLPPKARDLGFVFQNYALFEHLTVADNVEFALRVRKVPRHARQARREELLELVGLGGSARKYPSQLSGGQRQRTALARALAHRPRLVLLDEPFGALDARIRQELRHGLRDLLKRVGTTAVFVTHDQEEAFAVADRIMVLHRGHLLEQGPPGQLYREPRTEFVAGFVGRANLLPGELTRSGVRVRLAGTPAGADAIPKRVKVLLRPEAFELLPVGGDGPRRTADGSTGAFSTVARVERTEYLGASERLHLVVEGDEAGEGRRSYLLEALRAIDSSARLPLVAGDRVRVVARQLHVVSQPNLRLLVVADDDDAGRALAENALLFGERRHAVVTLLGGLAAGAAWRSRLERYRQAFAGDLKVVETEHLGAGLFDAAATHLQGERYDLVALPASLRGPERVVDLLRSTDVGQLLLAASVDAPLAATGPARWSALLRAFSASQPDLDLLAELAGGTGARVEVRDLVGARAPVPPPPRWHEALSLQRVPFTVERDSAIAPENGAASLPIDESAELVAVDLGPRAGLGPRQQACLQALDGRWLLLMVQADESDLRLRPAAAFPHGPEPAPPAAIPLPTGDHP